MILYVKTLLKYGSLRGRARRLEYWNFVLVQIIAILIISFVERYFAIANPEFYAGPFTAAFILATIPPAFAVTARRLHDLGRSAWWTLCYLIPIAGCIVMLILTLWRGAPGANRYGPESRTSICRASATQGATS